MDSPEILLSDFQFIYVAIRKFAKLASFITEKLWDMLINFENYSNYDYNHYSRSIARIYATKTSGIWGAPPDRFEGASPDALY